MLASWCSVSSRIVVQPSTEAANCWCTSIVSGQLTGSDAAQTVQRDMAEIAKRSIIRYVMGFTLDHEKRVSVVAQGYLNSTNTRQKYPHPALKDIAGIVNQRNAGVLALRHAASTLNPKSYLRICGSRGAGQLDRSSLRLHSRVWGQSVLAETGWTPSVGIFERATTTVAEAGSRRKTTLLRLQVVDARLLGKDL